MVLDRVEQTMKRLAARRLIFHSEADFQHAFAWQLQLDHPGARIRLETRPRPGVRLDVLAAIDDRRVAYELKYLLRNISANVDGEVFDLPNQGAQDVRRYDFVKDIARLEVLVRNGLADEGYAIALTNDPNYWQAGDHDRFADAAFRLSEGGALAGSLAWAPHTGGGTMRGREDAIALTGTYELGWRDFSEVEGGRYSQFRYLVVQVSER